MILIESASIVLILVEYAALALVLIESVSRQLILIEFSSISRAITIVEVVFIRLIFIIGFSKRILNFALVSKNKSNDELTSDNVPGTFPIFWLISVSVNT